MQVQKKCECTHLARWGNPVACLAGLQNSGGGLQARLAQSQAVGRGKGSNLNVWVQIPNLLLCGWGGSGKFSGSLQPAFPPVKMEAIMKVGVSMKHKSALEKSVDAETRSPAQQVLREQVMVGRHKGGLAHCHRVGQTGTAQPALTSLCLGSPAYGEWMQSWIFILAMGPRKVTGLLSASIALSVKWG